MLKTNACDIEALFSCLNSSVLLGKKTESKMYLDILRSEFEHNEENFKVLQDGRMDHLIKIGKVIDNDLTIRDFNLNESISGVVSGNENFVEKEKELSDLICKHPEVLKKSLKGSNEFEIVTAYCPTRYGIADIIARDKEKLFVVELKKETAKHDIVSQLEKYMIHFKLKLNYKLWKEVIGVTIANSYQDFALQELSKIGVICFQYSFNEKLILERI